MQNGDLVFYDTDGGGWDHVAVIIGFGYPTISAKGEIVPPIVPAELEWLRAFLCTEDTPEYVKHPLVVERNGAIGYDEWFSSLNFETRKV